MKHLVLSLAVISLAGSTLLAQGRKELSALLLRDLESYQKHTLAMNFDSSLLFMPPKMFELTPLDSVVAATRRAFGNEHMRIEFQKMDYKSKGKVKIKKAGAYHWAFVPYDATLRVALRGEQDYKNLVKKMIKAEYGDENIQEEDESTFRLTERNKRIIAVKDPASPIWWFLEDKRKKSGDREGLLFYQVIPVEVQKAIGNK